MTTAYTSLLGLALPVTGELSGTWGDTVNNGITSLLDTSVAGTTNISVDTDVTLTTTTGASNTARQAILLFSGARTALRTVVAPAQSKTYTVINATTGGFAVKLVGSGPTTGVTIIAGESAFCAWNGSDFVKVSNTGGAYTVTDLTVTGNTILGDANTDTATINALARFNTVATFGYAGATGSTLTTSAPAFVYSGATTYTDTSISGGTKTHGPFWSFAIPTLANPTTATTYTNASTLYIAGAPAAGTNITITNPYALYVAAGAAYFGGAVSFIGNTTLTTTTVTSLTDSGLTAGRVTYAGTAGLLQDSANLTFNGTTLTAGGLTTTGTTSTGVLSVTGNTTLGDAAADSVTVTGTITSNLIFTDNTYDIGASGATRPRNLFLSGSGNVVGTLFKPEGSFVQWNSTGLTGGTNRGIIWADSSARVYIGAGSGNSTVATFDSGGNTAFGGVVPSAWPAGYNGLQFGFTTNRASALFTNGVDDTWYVGNAYFNGTNWVKYATGTSTAYEMLGGKHQWYNALTGVANSTTITSGLVYVVYALGSSTLGQWQAFFSGLSSLPTVGQTITATATGTLAGGGTVSQTFAFTQAMTLTETGQLLIGTTNGYDAQFVVSNAGTNAMEFSTTAIAGENRILSYNRTTSVYQAQNLVASQFKFLIGTTQSMTLDSSGSLQLGTTLQNGTKLNVMGGNIVPATSGSTQNGGVRISSLGTGTGGYVLDMGVSDTNGYAWMQVSNSANLASGFTKPLVLQPVAENVGLGVVPSAWSLYRAFQNGATSVADFASGNNSIFGSGVYYGGSPTDFRYISTGQRATSYRQVDGSHTWNTTGTVTGTAGGVAAMVQAMTLNSEGLLTVGTTVNGEFGVIVAGGAKSFSAGIPQYQFQAQDTTAMAAGVGGAINFVGKFTSGGSITSFASIEASKDNATSGDYGASLVFKTRVNGGAQTTRMTLDAGGRLLLGGATSASATSGTVIYNYTGNNQPYNNNSESFWSSNGNITLTNQYGTLNIAAGATKTDAAPYWMVGNVGGNGNGFYINLRSGFSGSGGGDAPAYRIQYGGTATAATITSHTWTIGQTSTGAMTLDSSGNLLVGTTSVYGKFSLVGANNANPLAVFYSDTAGDVGQPGLMIGKQDNNTTTSQIILRATILSSGAGQGQINANGANALAFGTYSDRRLKENIVNLPSQLANILALRPVEFDYIESEGGGHQTGFIAQEMQQIYSDAVGEREDGMLTVSGWSKTEARLVKAIQEQQAIIESLKARLDAANL